MTKETIDISMDGLAKAVIPLFLNKSNAKTYKTLAKGTTRRRFLLSIFAKKREVRQRTPSTSFKTISKTTETNRYYYEYLFDFYQSNFKSPPD